MEKKVDIKTIELDDIHIWDYPDFSDAYISYAEYEDGTPLTEDELVAFSDENLDLINELAHERMF